MELGSLAIRRFWAKVRETPFCWVWTAAVNNKGYGKIRIDKILYHAHRLSWIIYNGPIPPGLCVLHTCDNPRCVRPSHLFLGTKGDNARDMVSKGRHWLQVKHALNHAA